MLATRLVAADAMVFAVPKVARWPTLIGQDCGFLIYGFLRNQYFAVYRA